MTISEISPPELARETLRTLAARKLAPTPENYSAIFSELSGNPVARDRPLRALTAALEHASWLADEARHEYLRLARAGEWERVIGPLVDAGAPAQDPQFGRLLEQFARLVEYVQPALGEEDPHILPVAQQIARDCRALQPGDSLQPLCARLADFGKRVAFVAEEQADSRVALVGMLRLILENIASLAPTDDWLEAQVRMLLEVCAAPLSLRRLEDLQRRLRDVVFKQQELQRAACAAQESKRVLFAEFMSGLAELAEVSGENGEALAACAAELRRTEDPVEIRAALDGAVGRLQDMAERSALMSRALGEMHGRVSESEAEVARLRTELDALATAIRHDALTGALNRKGLDEALVREVARARRVDSPLCIALLDIDNFKVINDQHGHPVGDGALAHLADLARSVMRAQDSLCRYGGEEFVILMPDTEIEDAVLAIQKLQRTLTSRLFVAEERRIPITFSAGLVKLGPEEEPGSALERADRGMYQAKRTGKNRVVVA